MERELMPKFLRKKPLKAIETINTLKLVNMLYRSYEKNRWVNFEEKNLKSRLGF